MSYIKSILGDDEKLIKRGRLHWIAFWAPLAYALVGLFFYSDGMGYVIRFFGLRGLNRQLGFTRLVYGIESSTGIPAHMIVAYSFFIIAAVYLYNRVVRFLTTEIGMTDRRVIVKVGWLRTDAIELLLEKVEAIVLHRSIFGQVFGFGSLTFLGSGLGGSTLRWVAKPLEFHKAVQAQLASMEDEHEEGKREKAPAKEESTGTTAPQSDI